MLEPYEGFLPPLDLKPDPNNDRRDFLRKAGMAGAAAAAAAVGVPLLGAPIASASSLSPALPHVPSAPLALPQIGQTINCNCNAFGATLLVNLPPPLPTLNFIGSIVVKVTVGGPNYVQLQVLDHTVQAAHPLFGAITIKLPDINVSPASLLSLGPGGFLQTMLLSFKITFEKCGDCPGPFNFETLQPAKLVANMLQFPPPPQGTNADGSPTGGQLYQLQNPINIGQVGAKPGDPVFMQLQGMNINVGQVLG